MQRNRQANLIDGRTSSYYLPASANIYIAATARRRKVSLSRALAEIIAEHKAAFDATKAAK